MPKRSDKPLQLKKAAFLAAYRLCGNVTHAAEASEVGRDRHYAWLKSDAAYAKEAEAATAEATERLEAEARRRATQGVKKLVLYQGKPVMVDGEYLYEHQYSDVLLIFLLKGAKPEKYRERHNMELSGPGGVPLFKAYVDVDTGKV